MKPVSPQAKMAVEIIYANLNNLPHPDHGSLRMMYFGHTSDGQRKITRATAEALVMLLEANGHVLCNGLSEAAELLKSNGYLVESPQVSPVESLTDPLLGIAATDDVEVPDTIPLFHVDEVEVSK